MLGIYNDWLQYEHFRASQELYGPGLARRMMSNWNLMGPGYEWHCPDEGRMPPEPSTRAAVVLSAVGCPLS